jgi:prepilin-type N-terminal cleavage/methylation domain-containing protein
MRERGFSLVEMVLVIAIISILLAVGTLKFNDYAKRYRTESQTRMIYSLLQKARANAVYERRPTRVKLYANRFEIYSSLADNGAAPIVSQPLSYPIVWNQNGNTVEFDSKGMTTVLRSICLDAGAGTGAVDSIVVHFVRTSIGKKDSGDGCNADSITKQ